MVSHFYLDCYYLVFFAGAGAVEHILKNFTVREGTHGGNLGSTHG